VSGTFLNNQEPKRFLTPFLRPDTFSSPPNWPGVRGPAEVEEQGIGIAGCTATWEALTASLRVDSGSGDRRLNPRPAVGRPGPPGAKPQAHRRVSPSEGNGARREGRRESHSALVPRNLGNASRRTQGRERRCRRADPARGTKYCYRQVLGKRQCRASNRLLIDFSPGELIARCPANLRIKGFFPSGLRMLLL
jgi:hypothetical protein